MGPPITVFSYKIKVPQDGSMWTVPRSVQATILRIYKRWRERGDVSDVVVSDHSIRLPVNDVTEEFVLDAEDPDSEVYEVRNPVEYSHFATLRTRRRGYTGTYDNKLMGYVTSDLLHHTVIMVLLHEELIYYSDFADEDSDHIRDYVRLSERDIVEELHFKIMPPPNGGQWDVPGDVIKTILAHYDLWSDTLNDTVFIKEGRIFTPHFELDFLTPDALAIMEAWYSVGSSSFPGTKETFHFYYALLHLLEHAQLVKMVRHLRRTPQLPSEFELVPLHIYDNPERVVVDVEEFEDVYRRHEPRPPGDAPPELLIPIPKFTKPIDLPSELQDLLHVDDEGGDKELQEVMNNAQYVIFIKPGDKYGVYYQTENLRDLVIANRLGVMYECVDRVTPDGRVPEAKDPSRPYVGLPIVGGFKAYVLYYQLLELLDNPQGSNVYVLEEDVTFSHTGSWEALYSNIPDRWVSANHCQNGSSITTYTIARYTNGNGSGGGAGDRKAVRKAAGSTRKPSSSSAAALQREASAKPARATSARKAGATTRKSSTLILASAARKATSGAAHKPSAAARKTSPTTAKPATAARKASAKPAAAAQKASPTTAKPAAAARNAGALTRNARAKSAQCASRHTCLRCGHQVRLEESKQASTSSDATGVAKKTLPPFPGTYSFTL
jgi:hypothetical protein